VRDFEIICGELAAFSESLAAKPMIVVATKLDATTDRSRLERLREHCAERKLDFYAISSATGEGIAQLVRGMADVLERLTPPESAENSEAASQSEANDSVPPSPGPEAKRASGAEKS